MFDFAYIMRIVNLVTICVETLVCDVGYSLEKAFNKLIHMHPLIVFYLTINQVDSCHTCILAFRLERF